jgi:hypothetical protein
MSSLGDALQGFRQKTRGRRGIRGNSAKKNKSKNNKNISSCEALFRARHDELVERTSVPRVFSRSSSTGRRLRKKWRLPLRCSKVAVGREAYALLSKEAFGRAEFEIELDAMASADRLSSKLQAYFKSPPIQSGSLIRSDLAARPACCNEVKAPLRSPLAEAAAKAVTSSQIRHVTPSKNQRRRNLPILTDEHVVRAARGARVHHLTTDAARENCSKK